MKIDPLGFVIAGVGLWSWCPLQAVSSYTLARKEDLVRSDNTPKSAILESKFAGVGGLGWGCGVVVVVGGWITFYLKQTWLTNGD